MIDIAAQADMTPAAVYYHFASKEQILLEAVGAFRDGLLAEAERISISVTSTDDLVAMLVQLIAWCNASAVPSRVYFVHSTGLNTLVEAVRRETRRALVDSFRSAIDASRMNAPPAGRARATGEVRDGEVSAETGVMAAALVSLLETAVVSIVTRDSIFSGLGPDGFSEQVSLLARSISGVLHRDS